VAREKTRTLVARFSSRVSFKSLLELAVVGIGLWAVIVAQRQWKAMREANQLAQNALQFARESTTTAREDSQRDNATAQGRAERAERATQEALSLTRGALRVSQELTEETRLARIEAAKAHEASLQLATRSEEARNAPTLVVDLYPPHWDGHPSKYCSAGSDHPMPPAHHPEALEIFITNAGPGVAIDAFASFKFVPKGGNTSEISTSDGWGGTALLKPGEEFSASACYQILTGNGGSISCTPEARFELVITIRYRDRFGREHIVGESRDWELGAGCGGS